MATAQNTSVAGYLDMSNLPNPPSGPEPSASETRILVIDDSLASRETISEFLRGDKVSIRTAPDGAEGIRLVRDFSPHVVLLDVMMPGIDGYETCRRIKSMESIPFTPVIMITALSGKQDIANGLDAGADDFLHKPVHGLELRARVRTQLRLRAERDRLDRMNQGLLGILQQLQLGAVLLDSQNKIAFLNRAAGTLTQFPAEQVTGQDLCAAFEMSGRDRDGIRALLDGPRPSDRLRVTIQRGHDSFCVDMMTAADPGDPRCSIVFFYDLTENVQLKALLDERTRLFGMVGSTPRMRRLFSQMVRVAASDSTALIQGETGTGKELVARAIHDASPRSSGPFVAINCAGIPDALAMSLICGHKRGAFTDAHEDRPGVFESANRGTLFLDEIGDLSPLAQRALLRVLQEREVMRLGETTLRKVDVRIVVATHKDLAAEVQAGRFREDLLYRIRVARLEIPPLRERKEDIPRLVAFILDQLSRTGRSEPKEIALSALAVMMGYSWPGNVRELRSALEYAVVNSVGSVVVASDLPPELAGEPFPTAAPDESERERIVQALRETNGNRAAAAEKLQMGRATLYRKLARLSLT